MSFDWKNNIIIRWNPVFLTFWSWGISRIVTWGNELISSVLYRYLTLLLYIIPTTAYNSNVTPSTKITVPTVVSYGSTDYFLSLKKNKPLVFLCKAICLLSSWTSLFRCIIWTKPFLKMIIFSEIFFNLKQNECLPYLTNNCISFCCSNDPP